MHPNIESLEDSVKTLEEATGRSWSARQVLQIVLDEGLAAQAVTPQSVSVNQSVWNKDGSRTFANIDVGNRRAELNATNISELLDQNETFVTRPAWTSADIASAKLTSLNCPYDVFVDDLNSLCASMPPEFEHLLAINADSWRQGERLHIITHLEFSEPVRVTPADVLITRETLEYILRDRTQKALSRTEESRTIPGKMPKTAIGKAAIKAAWQLELQNSRRPNTKEVMTLLIEWATQGAIPDVLKSVGIDGRSVEWTTAKGDQKNFGREALGKALGNWWKNRDSADGRQNLGTLGRK